jgi:hypothetical protein
MSIKKPSEAVVCRMVYDRNEVLEAQVFNTVLENLGEILNQDQLSKLRNDFKAVFSRNTSGLVDTVSNHFSGK